MKSKASLTLALILLLIVPVKLSAKERMNYCLVDKYYREIISKMTAGAYIDACYRREVFHRYDAYLEHVWKYDSAKGDRDRMIREYEEED